MSISWPSSTVPGAGSWVGGCAWVLKSQVSSPNLFAASMIPLVSHTAGGTGVPSRPGGLSSTTRSRSKSSLRSKRQIEPSRPFSAITGRLWVVPSSWIIRKRSDTSMLSGLNAVSPPSSSIWSAL